MDDLDQVLLSCLDLDWEGDEAWLCNTLTSLFSVNEGDDDQFSDHDHDHENAYMEENIVFETDFVDIIEEALAEMLDDINPGPPKMRPASKTAIQGLQNVKIDQRPSGAAVSCTVCFEEFSIGTEAKRLPCSHVYHEGCIVKWLNESNTCPLCRYEMPVVDFDFDLNLIPMSGLDSDGDSMITAAD